MSIFNVALLAGAIRQWTPIALAASGGVLSERAGVVNIALEGMMLAGAFAAVAVAHTTQSAVFGVAGGMAAGATMGLLHAVLTQNMRVPHILSGVGLNLGMLGLTAFALHANPGGYETRALLPAEAAVTLAAFCAATLWLVLSRTALGLRIRACGENPRAARSAGLDVVKLRYGAVIISGILAGLGGASLSLVGLGEFTDNMTSGRGYIALAAVIFGRWNPALAVAAALLFGLGDALQQALQTSGFTLIPKDLLTLLPYVLTLAALFFTTGKSAAPAALGETEG